MPSQNLQSSIPDFKKLILYTGNVMLNGTNESPYWNTKSTSELLQAISDVLDININSDIPSYRYVEETELLEMPIINSSSHIELDDRREIEVTAKLFCLDEESDIKEEHIERSIDYLKQVLSIESIDRFVVSSESNLNKIWAHLEKHYEKGTVSELGVSDLNHERLSNFISNGEVKINPSLNQIHVDTYCNSLPEDLIQLGNLNQIEMTYNTDISEILTTKSISQLLRDKGIINETVQVRPNWVLKYNVFHSNRAIVTDKGYIVVGEVA